jgi:hypothetical protein
MEDKSKSTEEVFFVGFTLSSIGPWAIKVTRRKLHNFRRPPIKITQLSSANPG